MVAAPLPVVMDKACGNAGEKGTAGTIRSSRPRSSSLRRIPFFNAVLVAFGVKRFLKPPNLKWDGMEPLMENQPEWIPMFILSGIRTSSISLKNNEVPSP